MDVGLWPSIAGSRCILSLKAQWLLDILARNPFQNPLPYEKLVGDLAGAFSRRINIQHRLVYQVYAEQRTVKVIRMWTHYEGVARFTINPFAVRASTHPCGLTPPSPPTSSVHEAHYTTAIQRRISSSRVERAITSA